jgi:mRNA interferase MazF
MDVGDLFWGDLPSTDGREQSGRRPVMVLQDDAYAGRLPTVLIVPLTSSTAATRYPGTVLIPATAANGLSSDSVLLVFQLRALDRNRFGSYIGAVEPAILAQVYQALDKLTGHP